MAKLPIVSGKQVIKALCKIDYCVARQKGSHVRLLHRTKDPVTIPNHKILGKGLLHKILRTAQLSAEDFISLLK